MKSEYLRVFDLYDGKERKNLCHCSRWFYLFIHLFYAYSFSFNFANISVYFAIFFLSLSLSLCHYLFVNHIKMANCIRVHTLFIHKIAMISSMIYFLLYLSFFRVRENSSLPASNPILVFEGFVLSTCRIFFSHPDWTIGYRSGSVKKKQQPETWTRGCLFLLFNVTTGEFTHQSWK